MNRCKPVCTCAGGGAEALTTGAWQAGAAEELWRSPDRRSRASQVPMVGCRRRRRQRGECKGGVGGGREEEGKMKEEEAGARSDLLDIVSFILF